MSEVRLVAMPTDEAPEGAGTKAPTRLSVPECAPLSAVADARPTEVEPTHLLHFEPLTAQGAGLDIPCDPQGHVGLDALGDKARNDYFYARALIGCVFARPTVKQAMSLMRA